MAKINRRYLLMPAVLIALVLAFMFVQPVHADDGTTADATAEITETPEVTETPAPTLEMTETAEVTETAEPTDTTEVIGTETAEPTEEIVPEATDDVGSSLAETLDELADSGLELVDAAGESVSVVSRDSGDLLVSGDPYFTIGSVTYHFYPEDSTVDCTGDPYCFKSANPIQDALDYMTANNLTPSDRKLYIEADDYLESVLVDGSLSGVSGLTGLVGLGTTADDVVISGSITVTNMSAGFSLTNLSVENSDEDGIAIYMHDNAGTVTLTDVNATADGEDGSGLVLKDTGSVVLNRVDASENGYVGAWIETGGTVTITNSSFNGNAADYTNGNPVFDFGSPRLDGLYIYSNGSGTTTLNGVTADDNLGLGAVLSNSNAIVIKNSSFSNNASDYDDYDRLDADLRAGLVVFGKAVTLDGVTASDNGSVTLDVSGMAIQATASLTAYNLTASRNTLDGLYAYNCVSAPCDVIGKVYLRAVQANDNDAYGIRLGTRSAVTFYDVTADRNAASGIWINNVKGDSTSPVVLSFIEASENGQEGLKLDSYGAVTITNIAANDNVTGAGVLIQTNGTVAINLSSASPREYNSTSGNGGFGTSITSTGAVTVVSLLSSGNGSQGLKIDNTSSTTTAPVTVKTLDKNLAPATFNDNGSGGLDIHSNGVISLTNVECLGNSGYGATLVNDGFSSANGAAVTISYGNFSENSSSYGLQVTSRGLITLLNVNADNNAAYGARLNNQASGATLGVILKASKGAGNSFYSNNGDGLDILTNGAVTLTNVSAVYNSGIGLDLNSNGTGAVNIKQSGSWTLVDETVVYGNTFNSNETLGLRVVSYGPVTVAFYQAADNGSTGGIYIDNSSGSGAVTVNGASAYAGNLNGNLGTGLEILSTGNIIVNRVDASANGGYGAHLVNDGGSGLVTISYGYFDGNLYGLSVGSTNNITWKNGSASSNTNFGAMLYNSSSLYIKPVALTNITADHNGQDGIEIGSNGLVTLTNVSASDNSTNGGQAYYGRIYIDTLSEGQTWTFDGASGDNVTVEIDSDNFTAAVILRDEDGNLIASGFDSVNVTLPGTGTYTIYIEATDNNRGQYRLDLHSTLVPSGALGISTNIAYGIEVSNVTGTTAGVTLKNSSQLDSSNNSAGNVYISSNGAITITNMIMNDSGGYGLYVDNSTATSGTPAVTLTGLVLSDNAGGGAMVMTLGAVKVKNLTANGNNSDGLNITNDLGDAPSLVSLTGVTALENYGAGIYLSSNGAVTLLTVTADWNGGDGINITTLGAVTAATVNANLNAGTGLTVSTEGSFTLKKPSSGQNHFDDNQMDGLNVSAGGKVSLTRVTADGNGYYGGDTPSASATGITVSIGDPTGASAFVASDVSTNGNTYTGLNLDTNGAVTISLLEANDNTDAWGLYVKQGFGDDGTYRYAYPVTLSKINASHNGFDGISVEAVGNITLSKFTANYNGGGGVSLNNSLTDAIGTVTILNPGGARYYNQAIGNGGVGVNIESNYAVKVTGLVVEDNYYDGLVIRNNYIDSNAAVTLSAVFARNNGTSGSSSSTGVYVTSHGVVTISSSLSTANYSDGFQIWSWQNVYIYNTSSMTNGSDGFFVSYSTGGTPFDLTLKGCTWFGNLRHPIYPTSANLEFIGDELFIL